MNFELRKSLTLHPTENMHKLMEQIEEYKRLKDDQTQGQLKEKYPVPERQEKRIDLAPLRPRRNFFPPNPIPRTETMSLVFKEPVHHILERIKHEPYFKWPNKMSGDASQRNQNLNCSYHREQGHTTEDCRVLQDRLNHLVKIGHLKKFSVPNQTPRSNSQGFKQP